MSSAGRTRPSLREVLLAGWIMVLIAVLGDFVAGRPPAHVVVIAALGAALAVWRLLNLGRHPAFCAVLSSAVVAQPVWHALSATGAGSPSGLPGFRVGDDASVVIVLLAIMTTVGVGLAESLLDMAAVRLASLLAVFRSVQTSGPVRSEPAQLERCEFVAPVIARPVSCPFVVRRGPPAIF